MDKNNISEVNYMNKKCYEAVIAEMKVLLDGQKFVAEGDIFKNEDKAVKVYYSDEQKLFILAIADVVSGEVGEFTDVASWLFGDDQNEKDAVAVGVDFADTLRGKLGIKASAVRSATNIALPTSEKGESVNVSALTQRLLANFPQFKETYKASVAKYGKFLYLDFFTTYFVPEIKNMLAGTVANKKQLKKLFDMLDEVYVDGDAEATDAVVAIIAAAVYGNDTALETVNGLIEENKHLKLSLAEFLGTMKKNKKLQKALIK